MKSILETLDAATIETLLTWCEDHPYNEVKKLAAKPPSEGGLGLKISASTLCRLYTSHGIAESKEARAQYANSLGLGASGARLLPSPTGSNQTILDAAQDQLELRLLELAARPNPSVAELRLLSQIVTRLRALQLGERRVQVAEKRETRLATPPPAPEKPKLLSPAEIKHRIRVYLGKEHPREYEQTDNAATTCESDASPSDGHRFQTSPPPGNPANDPKER